ncbi:protein phosphatase 2C domain-containing protein [Streptomyces sp. NBC_01387]|uniref:PP2C family serine/threonine-protein phosphatase n=1 Tax=unclassified Streptomyces TaxID=2593676 RepID=UPI0020245D83|nr:MULTISPECIES: PP2C family serine/threonine-protein phosphatase [unclassified Streptomyces]MCX4551062.1 protein phosphatase 2C domain-containing protein [Streptomyces sp. NBC_01500]WSC22472.1 protein phosphatase 2C domain-containing protein [Streptomyces sp. NBC_01766]WSV56315.1 protein phosphatase 2C domain-containing protein [Streptomyces sp. NBC_01014]
MSQTNLAACPSCEEPLEPGDLFCGACGYDLSAVPEPPDDRPASAVGGTGPAPGVAWPDAAEGTGTGEPAPVQTAGDVPGVASDGSELPPVVRFDGPPSPAEYALPAPDPAAAAAASAPPEGTKVCVACRTGRIDDDGYCENCGHAQPRERDHMEEELDAVAAVSDRGLRHHRNEDAFAVSSAALPDGSPAVVAVVCDGVSSATRPDEASAAAAAAAKDALQTSLPAGVHPQQALHEAILASSEAVNSLAAGPDRAMEHGPHHHQNAPACTLVAAIVAGGLLVVGWVGDSRVYWVPDDRTAHPSRLTEDDSWAAQMVATGLMSEAQAYADERAHAITGWLGADAYELEPHTASFKPDRPGVVVVCSDGLWNYAESAEEMTQVVPADASVRPLHCAQVLVGHALDGGGHDNVTVAVVPFRVPAQGAGSACTA